MNEALAMDVLDLLGWKGKPEFLKPAKESQGFYQLRGPSGEKITLCQYGEHIYVGGIYPWNSKGGDVLGVKSRYNKALDKHEILTRRPQVRILAAEATALNLTALVQDILPAHCALRQEILDVLKTAAPEPAETLESLVPEEYRRAEVGD